VAAEDTEQDKAAPSAEAQNRKRRTNRGSLPAHLPRVHITLTPDSTACPCCRGAMHVIGEDTAERLDKIPAQYQVIVTHRPKYGCRACEGAIVQVPAAERLIKSGIPTENLVADVVVDDKYAWHKPLYRQAQIMWLQGLPSKGVALLTRLALRATPVRQSPSSCCKLFPSFNTRVPICEVCRNCPNGFSQGHANRSYLPPISISCSFVIPEASPFCGAQRQGTSRVEER
jgi:transposase